MRVRIAYGVNMEDVPSKVKNMIEEACMSLGQKVQLMEQLAFFAEQRDGMSLASHHINEIRSSLSDLDTVLADAQAIAEGYVKVLEGPNEGVPPMPEAEPQTGNTPDVREG